MSGHGPGREASAPSAAPGPLDRWYATAGVRSGVRRIFHDEAEQGLVFFPDRLVPHLAHEAVRELPPERARTLALWHLYQFLISTTHLETRIVNVGAESIATGRAGVDLPAAARLDAFKVYCDEGYHALYSLDLVDQIAAVTGVPVPPWDYGAFVDRLAAAARQLLPAEPMLAHLLQVVVFETLITAVLNELPADPTVATTVRDVLRDHACDEGRHHRFFAAFFHELWHQLDRGLRLPAARALPRLIDVCLSADVGPVRSALLLAGLDPASAESVVRDCYGGGVGDERRREISRATVRMCRSAGVFEVPGAHEAFAEHGIEPDRV
jgi:P-aminobenzoate N-oxygenase AurF